MSVRCLSLAYDVSSVSVSHSTRILVVDVVQTALLFKLLRCSNWDIIIKRSHLIDSSVKLYVSSVYQCRQLRNVDK
jgi:hypothetical protein